MEGTLVSAESNAQFIAFRRFVYYISQQLSQQEKQVLLYIRLYKHKEQYKDATILEIFAKLEADGLFCSSNPEGLVDVARDLQRQDLVGEVKEFIKKRNKKASSAPNKRLKSPGYNWDANSEEDLQLKATYEVALAQATVLMQHVESLEHALTRSGKDRRKRGEQAIREACQTASTLAERLKRAQVDLGMDVTQQREHTRSPDRFSPPGRPNSLPHSNEHAQSRTSAALPLHVPRHAPPQLMSRHSLPVMYPSPLRSSNPTYNPTSKLSSSVSTSQEILREEEEEEEDEDEYEKMYPARFSAFHELESSFNATAQSGFNTHPSSISPPSARCRSPPSNVPSPQYPHGSSISARTYDPQDCVKRKTSSGTNPDTVRSSGVQNRNVETHQVQVLKRVRGQESSAGQEASMTATNTLKSELEKRMVGGVPVADRDASSDSLVKPSRRKAPAAPPRKRSTVVTQRQASSYGYIDCAHHTTRVPSLLKNDSSAAERDDGYTTLHPLGSNGSPKAEIKTKVHAHGDSGLDELRQLRNFITTDPVLKESAGSAHYYKHLQRDDNTEDLDDPYTALNYGHQDP